jgi:ATP-dependent protease ClpP protease subunit
VRSRHAWKRPYNFQPTGRVGTWYAINNVSADLAEVSIYDEIGYFGITATSFVEDLKAVQAGTIGLHINSPGGEVFDGLAILNALRSHPAKVHVTVDGLAASAASFIAMAGDQIDMAPQSMMMIHDAQGLAIGDAGTLRELADMLDKTSNNIAAVYAQRTGKPVEHWREQMLAETWYTDQEAVDAGLADRVVSNDAPADDHGTTVVSDKVPATINWDDIDINVDELVEALKGVN